MLISQILNLKNMRVIIRENLFESKLRKGIIGES